jgi:Peptidase family M48
MSPPSPALQSIKTSIAHEIEGRELTLAYAREFFGEKKGNEFWRNLDTLKQRFQERHPHENFPPIFISKSETLASNSHYSSNWLEQEKKKNIDTTDKYEAVVIGIGDLYSMNKNPNSLLATIAHEAGHDGKNHTNQDFAKINAGQKPSSSAVSRQREIEADIEGMTILHDKSLAVRDLQNLKKQEHEFGAPDPNGTHPPATQRLQAVEQYIKDNHQRYLFYDPPAFNDVAPSPLPSRERIPRQR